MSEGNDVFGFTTHSMLWSKKDIEIKRSSLFIHSLGSVGHAVKVNMNPQKRHSKIY